MMKLIDADEAYKVLTDTYHHRTETQHEALKEALSKVPTVDVDNLNTKHEEIGYEKGYRDGYAEALEMTDDAEHVVRCKDCKYGSPIGRYGCKCYHYKLYETHEMSPNDFCSHAERKKDEDE